MAQPPPTSPKPPHGYCGHCGRANPHTATFCTQCGARLPWAVPAHPRPVTPSSPPAAPPDRLAKWAGAARTYHLLAGSSALLWTSVVFGILVLAFIWAATQGMPWIYAELLGAVYVLVIALQIVTLGRIASVNLDPAANPAMAGDAPVTVAADERVRLRIAGILWAGVRVSALGAGTVPYPHNALVVTDRHLLFIVLPVAGAGVLVGGTDFGFAHQMLARKALREKLDQMLATQTLPEIVRSDARNVAIPLADLRAVLPMKLLGLVPLAGFTVITRSGRRYRYSIWDRADREQLQAALRAYTSLVSPVRARR